MARCPRSLLTTAFVRFRHSSVEKIVMCEIDAQVCDVSKRFFANKRREEDATRTLAIAAKRASAAPGLPAAGAAAAALPPTEYEHPFFLDGTKGKPPAP